MGRLVWRKTSCAKRYEDVHGSSLYEACRTAAMTRVRRRHSVGDVLREASLCWMRGRRERDEKLEKWRMKRGRPMVRASPTSGDALLMMSVLTSLRLNGELRCCVGVGVDPLRDVQAPRDLDRLPFFLIIPDMAVRLAQCSSWHSARPAVSHLCTRSFTCTAHAREQHLLWAGTLLDQASCTHQPLSQDLFLAAGAGDDINAGHITLLEPSASPTRGHALLPYRTATDPPLTRIFAVGRNTFSQLGLGFASQEATFGLVRPGFSGDGGISSLIAAQGQTWIHTLPASDAQSDDQQQPSRLFACGNNTLGQLGLARSNGPSDSFQQPILHLLPAPRQVDAQDDSHIISVAAGLDHSLLLRRISRQDNTGNIIQVCSTGRESPV